MTRSRNDLGDKETPSSRTASLLCWNFGSREGKIKTRLKTNKQTKRKKKTPKTPHPTPTPQKKKRKKKSQEAGGVTATGRRGKPDSLFLAPPGGRCGARPGPRAGPSPGHKRHSGPAGGEGGVGENCRRRLRRGLCGRFLLGWGFRVFSQTREGEARGFRLDTGDVGSSGSVAGATLRFYLGAKHLFGRKKEWYLFWSSSPLSGEFWLPGAFRADKRWTSTFQWPSAGPGGYAQEFHIGMNTQKLSEEKNTSCGKCLSCSKEKKNKKQKNFCFRSVTLMT